MCFSHLRQITDKRNGRFIDHRVGAIGEMSRHERLVERSLLIRRRVGRLHRDRGDDQVDRVGSVLTGNG